jgi:hypothetical protein
MLAGRMARDDLPDVEPTASVEPRRTQFVASTASVEPALAAVGRQDAAMVRQQTSFAPQSNSTFVEPWMRRVRDVDDDTLAGLLTQLMSLRRLRNIVAALCCGAGLLTFGIIGSVSALYAILIYATLAAAVGFPVFAIGSLSVRRLFMREAQAQGLSRAAAMLVLTRAERRARLLSPVAPHEEKVEALMKAVRDPDEAT